MGRGGQLLDKMLASVGLSRQKNIYIANIVKCRPPRNRDPQPEEQEACINWLKAQTALIRPQDHCLPGPYRGLPPHYPGLQGHPSARGVFPEKRRVDDGDPPPRRPAAQSQPEAGRVCGFPGAGGQNRRGL